MGFAREVAEHGLVPSSTKYVLPREEGRQASLFFNQEIMSWLSALNQSSALLEMEKNPSCQGDGVISPGTYLILLLGPLFQIVNEIKAYPGPIQGVA